MNKQETTKIITFLAGNYDSIAKKDINQKNIMVNTWYECLQDIDYKLVQEAIKKSIMESPYPPTIADIRKGAYELIKGEERTAIDAWNEAHSMISCGLYMTKEEFEAHSPEVKRFFGSVRQVREIAMQDSETTNTVVKGQFLKQYEAIVENDRKQAMLPKQMQEISKLLADKMSIKQIGE